MSGADHAKTIASNDRSLQVIYAISPEVIPANEPFTIAVQVVGLDSETVSDLVLSIDAGMPEHGHGMNVEPTVTSLGHNMFRVDNMLFHMAGRWELYFDITRDGVTSRAQDEITLQ